MLVFRSKPLLGHEKKNPKKTKEKKHKDPTFKQSPVLKQLYYFIDLPGLVETVVHSRHFALNVRLLMS